VEVYFIAFCLLAALTIVELYAPDGSLKLPLAAASIVVLTLVSGLRWETGNDWLNYYENFQFATSLKHNETEFEIGYRALAVAGRSIGLDYTGFLLVSSLLANMAFVYVFARLGPVGLLSLMYYCSYFLGNMGTQRQTLAAAMVALAVIFSFDRRTFAAVAAVAAATLFHVSAAVGMVALVMPRRSPGLFAAMLAAGVALAGAWLLGTYATTLVGLAPGGNFVLGKLLSYVVADAATAAEPVNLALASAKRIVFSAAFLFLCRTERPSLENYILNLYLVSVLLFFAFIATIPILALRSGQYFTIFENYLIYVAVIRIAAKYWREASTAGLILMSAARLYWSTTGYEAQLFIP
jgi:hypothetical protein